MNDTAPVTLHRLQAMKTAGEKIAMITAYDFTFARLVDQAGADIVLVGDTLGMVIQGHSSTLPVDVADVVYHSRAVKRGLERAWLLADMPFLADHNNASAAQAAWQLLGPGGAQMIKIEGAGPMVETVEYLSQRGVSVCGHLGLTPQSVHRLGGFKVQGRKPAAADRILADAQQLEAAGAQLLVLEAVPNDLAGSVTEALEIPVVGIGAGPHCDGQVLVLQDLLGMSDGPSPKFVRNFMPGSDSILAAIQAYVAAVKSGEYPSPEFTYG